MNSKRIFFILSCVLLTFSIMNISLGPAINKKVGWSRITSRFNCEKKYDDFIERQKDSYFNMKLEDYNNYLFDISACKIKVAMNNMEYVSFIFNIIIGFICILISIYVFQEKPIPKSNFIGMACGLIGFILTLIYVILNGIVYTNYYEDRYDDIYKMESDASVAEYEGDKGFRCYYFSEVGNKKSFIAKYSDYIKSQYNYNKDLIDSFDNNEEKKNCSLTLYTYSYSGLAYYDINECATKEYLSFTGNTLSKYENCKKLYLLERWPGGNVFSKDFNKYNLGIRFLMPLLFSIFMLPCYCALIFFAFKLSSDSSDYKPVTT